MDTTNHNLEELVRLNSVKELTPILDKLAKAAQKEYDDWVIDKDGYDAEVGSGGICHLIADALIDVLSAHRIDRCHTVSSCHEQHVYIVGQFREGVYMIDVPYHIYETGGGFSWKKIPDVTFTGDDIDIRKLDSNPRNLKQYSDELMEVEYPLASKEQRQDYGGQEGWKGKIVWMSPEKFLRLAAPLPNPDKKNIARLKKMMVDKSPLDPLVLEVDMKRRKITSHEGRHRANAAKELGIRQVPVLIFTGSVFKRVPDWTPDDHSDIDAVDFKPEIPESLNETLSFLDLMSYTDKGRKGRARDVRVKSLPVSSEKTGESWNFRYKSNPSTTGFPYKGRITFPDDVNNKVSAEDQPCVVDCGCPDYQYRWAYANHDKDAGALGAGSITPNNGNRPNVLNPHLTPGLCKHLIALKDYLRTKLKESNQRSMKEGLNYIVSRYPTFDIGVSE